MPGYYSHKLAAQRLRTCYEIASPAVKQYLEAEIDFVISRLSPQDSILELGCGYGRVLKRMAERVHLAWGIDTSLPSLSMARHYLGGTSCQLAAMEASCLAFKNNKFDVVICIQNGISAFAEDQLALIKEALRVTRVCGLALFSSYAERFWPQRLEWFEAQAQRGLIGEIDHAATGDGVIFCKDGFRATTVTPDGFRKLAAAIGIAPVITEVAGSSVFCELRASGD